MDGRHAPAPGVRLARRLSPADVGRRVMVRHRLPDGATDVLGDLVRWDAGVLTVRRADGSEVRVAEGDVLAGKPVPPPPPRGPWHQRAGVLALEESAAHGWWPLEAAWLGRWLLRASGGFTGRGNSVLPLGDPGRSVEAALADVRDWYAARGLPPKFQVPLPACAELDDLLRTAGWRSSGATLVLTVDPRELADANGEVRIDLEPDESWFQGYHYRGDVLPPLGRRLLTRSPGQAFLSVRHDDGVLAVARVAGTRPWAGVTALEVAPHARRRGLARAVLQAAARHCAAGGFRGMYVQVEAGNDAALALYASLGFTLHHRYHYMSL